MEAWKGNLWLDVVDFINKEKLTADFSTAEDEDGNRQMEDPDVKFLGRVVDSIFHRFCLSAANPTYALEKNIIGHTNAIAIGITKEHISYGYEVRYSVTGAIIENRDNTNVVRNCTQLQYMEMVWATHPAVEDRFPLMLHLVLDFTTLKMEDPTERFSGARWNAWQARWEPTPTWQTRWNAWQTRGAHGEPTPQGPASSSGCR